MTSSDNSDGWFVETVKTVVYALLIAGVFRTLFFQPFWIPSGSMKDTLLVGDFLFVNKMAYGYSQHSCPFSACPFEGRILGSDPEVGDVVVFRHPTRNEDYIKRLVGGPGDKIQFKDGQLYINGTVAPQEPDGQFVEPYERQGPVGSWPECSNQPMGMGSDCIKERAIETLPNGVSHSVLNIRDGEYGDNTPVFTVPEDHYFFSGDNRDNSVDSRFPAPAGVHFVHRDLLIGRADRIMFSSAGRSMLFFWTWRGDRFFKAVE